jgi:hypothetical protein
MKITTIRIEEKQLAWIRANHPQNLSRIVREHLDDLMHRATPVNFHNAWRENAQKCYPYMQGGYCNLCWPAGVPDKSIWHQYIRENQAGKFGSLTFDEWSLNRHNNRQTLLDDWNLTNTDTISQEKSSETIPNQANIHDSLMSRIIRAIFRRH